MRRSIVQQQFIGTWNLVSYEIKGSTGAVSYPMTEHPMGRLSYTADGRVAVQVSAPDRARLAGGKGVVEAKAQREAFATYLAYYGDYEIHEIEGVVIHTITAALNPSWSGTEQRRAYHFDAEKNRLILEADSEYHGRQRHATLVWEKLE